MKRILFVLIFPLCSFGQFTFVPDDNFEQVLINLGVDMIFDDYVETAGIDTITYLHVSGYNIADLTGIEDFSDLEELSCANNILAFLDLSSNSTLLEVNCSVNQLISLDVRNGNNQGLLWFNAMNNQMLNCIDVNDTVWANSNWSKDTWTSFSTNCSVSGIDDNKGQRKKLIKVLDIFGREITPKPNIPLSCIFLMTEV